MTTAQEQLTCLFFRNVSPFQKLVATVTRRVWHKEIVKEATAEPREAAVIHKELSILCVPGNNDCMAHHTQPFTAPSSSQSGTLTSSGKVLMQHAKSSGHALLPVFDGIYMCNPFPSFGSEAAGWKAAGSIIPIHPPAVSSRQPILPSLAPPGSQTGAHQAVAQCVGSTLFWLVPGPCHAAATPVSSLHHSPTQHQASAFFSCLLRASAMSLFPQAVLPKDTAWCLKSTSWTHSGPLQAGMQTQSPSPNSMYVSRPTAHERHCTPMAVMRSQTHLCHHSGGGKCEEQNQWNGNFCCFLASGAGVASREQAWRTTAVHRAHGYMINALCVLPNYPERCRLMRTWN